MPLEQGIDVSVVTVSYRTGRIFRDCLNTLLAQSERAEIIVVDNGNSAADRVWLDRLAGANPSLRIIRPGGNIGFAAGCNRGAAQARGAVLAFVNPDLLVPPGSFGKIRAVLAENPGIWLCGGRLLNMDGSEQRGGRREVLTPWRCLVELLRLDRLAPRHPYFRRWHLLDEQPVSGVQAVPVVSGAFMVMPKARFTALGGLDERMFLHTEDVDLCLRVLLAGGLVVYCGDVPVYHQLSTSDVSRCFVEWHKTRSSGTYFFKHFRQTYPVWSLRFLVVVLWLRFALLALRHAPADLGRWLRRWRRRDE